MDRTITEASELLGLDVSTLRHQLRNGRLNGRKVGPIWVVTDEEIERYRRESLGRGELGRPPKRALLGPSATEADVDDFVDYLKEGSG